MDFQQQVEDIIANAQFGDLIEFSYPVGFSHWGVYDGDGHVIHFAVADEGDVMKRFRGCLQTVFPLCGDLLLGDTKIRRQPLAEINVPDGAHILISNNRHTFKPSEEPIMRLRRNLLLEKELPYNLFKLNCEHFATFIRYGKAVCNQIPGKTKNKEQEEATETFQKLVS
ncbi:hypothetical protein AALO_G00051430 [Alosa alosa]|uniref:LRAT domain-containing protein n=1 Tax=Alosa alosa TaxID=278164 RepID=A0AAV6H411_9TELE|nr:phospholipase A and acyltransferase 2-like [Alosa sapidissima]XP_048097389.1 phospholipase A and acyltransferase 2 [Alosa alosa]KAG5282025.1 hypothetical protein AALO_G00051430 [Alosa alosa]